MTASETVSHCQWQYRLGATGTGSDYSDFKFKLQSSKLPAHTVARITNAVEVHIGLTGIGDVGTVVDLHFHRSWDHWTPQRVVDVAGTDACQYQCQNNHDTVCSGCQVHHAFGSYSPLRLAG